MQGHVIGVFAAGGFVGNELLRQGGQQRGSRGQAAFLAVHLRQLVGRHGNVARGGGGGNDDTIPFLQQFHVRHAVAQDVADFRAGQVSHL
ncbi:MAG: hypothetical protein PUF10_08770 [Bacteroidales bacterium]|nr:hypothetical protein [Bacteroidales bacterium]